MITMPNKTEAVGKMNKPSLNGSGFSKPLPFRRMFRWGWFVVNRSRGPFFLALGLGIVNQALQKYVVVLVTTIVGAMSTSQSHSQPGNQKSGLLASLVPQDPRSAVYLAAALTVSGLCLVFAERVITSLGNARMLAQLQQALHDHLLKLGPSYHCKHDVGETTAIVSRFATGAQVMLRDVIAFPVVRCIEFLTALLFLVNGLSQIGDTPVAMRIVLLLALLILPLVSLQFASSLRTAFTRARESDLALGDELANSLAQPLEVQLMGATRQRSIAYGSKLAQYVRHQTRATVRSEVATQIASGTPKLLQLAFLATAVVAAANAHSPSAAAGIIAIYYFVPEAIQPIQQIILYTSSLSVSWPTVESVIEVLESEPDIVEQSSATSLPQGSQEVALRRVTFGYGNLKKPVLHEASAVFSAGATTALVGASGSGKSTIFNLVARLSDPDSGAVLFGEHDARSLRIDDLRRHVARVAQFPLFIVDTVRENFRLAKANATDEEIEAVCRKTGLWDVLACANPQAPLDYVLPRELSQGLSGGQRRLLAIARAMLNRPTVLLLDEPTAGLDNITLQLLIRFIKEHTAGVTVLIIDHDVEGFVAKTADQVCVLQDGRIAMSGTPAELAVKPGLYRDLLDAAKTEASRQRESEVPVGELNTRAALFA